MTTRNELEKLSNLIDGDRDLIIEWSTLPPVNSGNLVALTINLTDKQIRLGGDILAVSASSTTYRGNHICGEAPRLYQRDNDNHRTKWLGWFEHKTIPYPSGGSVIDPSLNQKEKQQTLREKIMENLQEYEKPSRV